MTPSTFMALMPIAVSVISFWFAGRGAPKQEPRIQPAKTKGTTNHQENETE